ncbi:hypothetical protein OUS17_002428 [Enterococcus faecium]|nr:hypothetical protein [Enterococcus faecium]
MEELQMVALNEILKQQQQIIESQEEIKKELQAIRNSKEQKCGLCNERDFSNLLELQDGSFICETCAQIQGELAEMETE